MADENRTQHATPRRRQKARDKGQVARSREVSGALALTTAVLVIGWRGATWAESWMRLFGQLLGTACSGAFASQSQPIYTVIRSAAMWIGMVLLLAWCAAVAGNILQGGFVVATEALTLKWDRMNPASNLQKLFSVAGLSNLLKSLIPMTVIAYLVAAIFARDWDRLLYLASVRGRTPMVWMWGEVFEISWKVCLVFLGWSLADHLLQRYHFEQSLRMSHQEVRDEAKETEGNPATKGRMRRMQRQLRRQLVLKRIERATVVVTNPIHYAVALEYRPEEMDAPVVVAKGRDLLAERIKETARKHGVTIIENPPLAQALYRSVQVGDTIPPQLYKAVAEILAFIFRAQARAQGNNTQRGASSGASRIPMSGQGEYHR